jgi:hypothetical protein
MHTIQDLKKGKLSCFFCFLLDSQIGEFFLPQSVYLCNKGNMDEQQTKMDVIHSAIV